MTSELFPNISLSARLFVYTSNNFLTPTQLEDFSISLQAFLESWKAHGAMLDAAFNLIANRVLLIVVDEKAQIATGCSIDSLNRHLQSSGIDWFSRNWVLHTSSTPTLNGSWDVSDLIDFHEKCRNGTISLDEYIINTNVLTVPEMREKLVQKVSESWHNQML